MLVSEIKINGVCRRDWIHSSGCDSRGNSAINRERNTGPYSGHATRESQGNWIFLVLSFVSGSSYTQKERNKLFKQARN